MVRAGKRGGHSINTRTGMASTDAWGSTCGPLLPLWLMRPPLLIVWKTMTPASVGGLDVALRDQVGQPPFGGQSHP